MGVESTYLEVFFIINTQVVELMSLLAKEVVVLFCLITLMIRNATITIFQGQGEQKENIRESQKRRKI